MRGAYTVREHDAFEVAPILSKDDVADLEVVAKNVLKRKDHRTSSSTPQ